MKAIELRKRTKEELEKTLRELRENLGKIIFKLSANKLKNVREIRNIKREIARVLTILKSKNS